MASFVYGPPGHHFSDPKKYGKLSVADQTVLEMGIPEMIVRMARATWLHEHGTDVQNATQLFQLAEELLSNGEKQRQAGKLIKLVEQEEKKMMEKHHEDALEKEKKKSLEEPSLSEKVVEDGCCEVMKLKVADNIVRNGDKATESEMLLLKKQNAEPNLVEVAKDKDNKKELRAKVDELARENHRLRQRKMCRKCKKVDLASSGVTFLPCGHFITCEACSETFDNCPACGKSIMGTVRTFLS